ncbi:hypothetical protein E3N88_41296 [Mikania micrantha]|uniref:Uncharacterized protein n=1 Tax=Mikania micrantha TaxID=192012 RepID=A0A5N6LQ53_9ASTR|nr:hypothetical protein E3N88_41296 [Mikania micrantha]
MDYPMVSCLLEDIEEMWLVQYAAEVTAVVEKFKIKKLTGVKSKELLLWITLSEIGVDDPPTGKITFNSQFWALQDLSGVSFSN